MRGRGRSIADIKPNGAAMPVFVQSTAATHPRHQNSAGHTKLAWPMTSTASAPFGRLRAARFQGIGTAHPCDR